MLKMYFFLENLSNIKNYDYDADKLKYIIFKYDFPFSFRDGRDKKRLKN